MYVPAWSPLSPAVLWSKGQALTSLPYPLAAHYAVSYYAARSGIYALFKALRMHGVATVLVPDYHSGNETRAIRAAGMSIIFYSIDRNLRPNLDELQRITADGRIGAMYVIHFIGWAQPMEEISTLCKTRGMLLIEDCALAFLSRLGTRPLGTFGDYSIFCLYKTLPVPNGGLLVQNRHDLPELDLPQLRRCSALSLMGRSSELLLSWIRLQSESVGTALFALKGAVGKKLTEARVARTPVGDVGFDLANRDLGMSPIGRYLAHRLNYPRIVELRRRNFLFLTERLRGVVPLLRDDLDEGVCPLFFPILVADKHAVSEKLQKDGIEAVEFWNDGDPEVDRSTSLAARFLRKHVLELPIHQDISLERINYVAERVRANVQ